MLRDFVFFGCLEGFWSQPQRPNVSSPWATMHVGFTPWLLYSSTHHSPEGFFQLKTSWAQYPWLQWSYENWYFHLLYQDVGEFYGAQISWKGSVEYTDSSGSKTMKGSDVPRSLKPRSLLPDFFKFGASKSVFRRSGKNQWYPDFDALNLWKGRSGWSSLHHKNKPWPKLSMHFRAKIERS